MSARRRHVPQPAARGRRVPRVRLVHWHAEEAAARAARLRAAGYTVEATLPDGPQLLRALRSQPPDALVIDLGRLPMQGRDVGLAVRHASATRQVPLVFVGGEPPKVERVRALLPDAIYCEWQTLRGALRRALAHPPESPAVPSSALAGYAGTPLPKKLGMRAGLTVGLLAAPAGFKALLGELPAGTRLRSGARGACDVLLWFVRDHATLARGIASIAARPDFTRLWILWPKRAARPQSDVTQASVRAAGLAHRLVDFKICAVDATWSGLAFARRAGTAARNTSRTPGA
jgi:CheY-like chemotaxis protein